LAADKPCIGAITLRDDAELALREVLYVPL